MPARLDLAAPDNPCAPCVLVQDEQRFLLFERPDAILEARDAGAVAPALERADAALRSGRWVAGFLAYEAAAAFGLATRDPDPEGAPLLWLGVFGEPRARSLPRVDLRPPADRGLRRSTRQGTPRSSSVFRRGSRRATRIS
jgi:para-aminobenzoate synthetase/4-amino-4-deoxychorismate lyase